MKKYSTMVLILLTLLWCVLPVWGEDSQDAFVPVCGGNHCALTICAYTMDGCSRIPLPGASFTLYSHDGTVLAHMTIGETGTVTLSHLSAGTYYLEQTGAPIGYRTMSQPLSLRLASNGSVILGDTVTSAVHILHRRMPWAAALWVLLPLSLLPAMVRLGLLYWENIAAGFGNFLRLVHLSQFFSRMRRILNIRKGNPTPDNVI